MAVPWLTVGRLVLNNLDTIIGVVRPGFTRKKADAAANQAEIMSQQIAELQTAVATSAEQIRDLAEQLKNVVTALDEASGAAAIERAKTRRFSLIAVAVSVVSICVALGTVFLH